MVDILLTTYNARPYLGAQVASLQTQTHRDWRLWVRDDGSTDGTPDDLAALARDDARIRILADGHRRGACGGFAWLLERVPAESAYVMFCDQDDVWLPDKIEVSLAAMQAAEREDPARPIVVHTDLRVVTEDLRLIAPSLWAYQSVRPELTKLNRLLIQNVVTGATALLNRPLRQQIGAIPPEAFMHDWWVALVAAIFGDIVHVPAATALYRQHRSNHTGADEYRRGLAGVVERIERGLASSERLRTSLSRSAEQATALLHRYGDALSPEQRRLLRAYGGLPACGPLRRKFRLLALGTLLHAFDRNIGLILRA